MILSQVFLHKAPFPVLLRDSSLMCRADRGGLFWTRWLAGLACFVIGTVWWVGGTGGGTHLVCGSFGRGDAMVWFCDCFGVVLVVVLVVVLAVVLVTPRGLW